MFSNAKSGETDEVPRVMCRKFEACNIAPKYSISVPCFLIDLELKGQCKVDLAVLQLGCN
jgi:hypothetical protein